MKKDNNKNTNKINNANDTNNESESLPLNQDIIDDSILLGKEKKEDIPTSDTIEPKEDYKMRRSRNNYMYNVLKETDNELKRVERGEIHHVSTQLYYFVKYLERKFFSLSMVVGAIMIIYYSNFFKNTMGHHKIDKLFLNLSIIFYTIAVCNVFYLCFYLPYAEGITSKDWSTKYPNMIPMISMFGVLGMLFLITAVWDVWGLYSIPMIIIMKLGLIFTGDWVPGGAIGSFICVFLCIGMIISGNFIDHDGYFH